MFRIPGRGPFSELVRVVEDVAQAVVLDDLEIVDEVGLAPLTDAEAEAVLAEGVPDRLRDGAWFGPVA